MHLISESASLLSALEKLNALSGDAMTLLALDADGRVSGTLTDGDVRRSLLAGASLQSPVSGAMHRSFRSLGPDKSPEGIRDARRAGLRLLPVLDADGRLLEILDLKLVDTCLPVRAMLMAGGRGERLRPLTDHTPKPLLRVGDSPIIDRNITALRRCGITDITVSTRYLAEQLEEHFSGTGVRCVRETEPLGTMGSIAMLPPMESGATLLMNSDLFTNISFEDMYLHHLAEHNDITIATISHTVSIPFATLTLNGDNRVTGIEEKPTITHYANAGIYLINNALLAPLRPERLDTPDFIEAAILAGRRVGHFLISGYWLDIGTPADFRQACELATLSKR